MGRRACAALASSVLVVAAMGGAIAQQARQGGQPTLVNFCLGWESLCLRRSCQAASCKDDCKQRRATCNKTGVFHFNTPGPRRYSSCEDRGLVMSRSGQLFRDIPGWKCP
jgi:hypothetical protein